MSTRAKTPVTDYLHELSETHHIVRYHYRAAAFSGVRTYSGLASGGTRICAVIACTGDTKDTCGNRFETYSENSTAMFEELTIIGTVPTPGVLAELEDSFIFPISLKVSIMPLEVQEYTYYKNITGEVTVHTLSLNDVSAELYTFGLWGRLFVTDGQDPHPPVDDPSSSTVHILCTSLLTFMLVSFAYNHLNKL